MKKVLLLLFFFAIVGWSVPKPLESIANYNNLLPINALN